MNVLIYRYGSVCEPGVMDALKRLGFHVIEETAEVFNKDILPAQAADLVIKHLNKHSFSFVFTINFFPWLSDVCNVFNLVYISLTVDSPVLELYSNSFANPCNRIFLFDSALYNELSPYNPECTFYIPLAADVARNDDICRKASPAQIRKFQADVSFVGSLYAEKCLYNAVKLPEKERGFAEALIEAQLNVYGYNFIEEALSDEFVETFCAHAPNLFHFPENSRADYKAVVAQQYLSVKAAEQERIRGLRMLSGHYNINLYTNSDTSSMPKIHNKGFAQYLTEMPLIFRHSKINLNMTAKSIRNGLSQRVFDVLSCGGFLITNFQNDLEDIFVPGEDLEVYTSLAELDDKIAFYLAHDEERKRIAQNGYNKAKALHSYDTRLLQMLDISFPET